VLAAAVIAMTGCDSCAPPHEIPDAVGAGKTEKVAVGGVAGEKKAVHDAPPPFVAEATIVKRSGEVTVARSEQTRKTPGMAGQDDALFVGDSVATAEGASAVLDIGFDTRLELGPSSRVSIGIHRPFELVLHVGRATLSGGPIKGVTKRFMLLTPGALVFYAGPKMDVAVAPTGDVRVDVVDCPKTPPIQPADRSLPQRPPRARCTILYAQEQEDLETGDVLSIDPALAVQRSTMQEVTGIDDWMAERAGSLGKDPAARVTQFAGWIGSALEDVRAMIDDIKARRERNKELIKTLRDLRKAGKADSSEAAAQAGEDLEAPRSEIEEVKMELTENSSMQYKLRHGLLMRWSQASLHLQLLEPELSDENLASVGKTPAQLAQALEDLGEEIHGLFSRKPGHKKSPKYMPKSFFKHGLDKPMPKKRIEKAP
jgi:hypothetical protein